MAKNVRVSVPEIMPTSLGTDPGSELEVYGRLWARRLGAPDGNTAIGPPLTLFERSRDDRLDLAEDKIFYNDHPGGELRILRTEFLELNGILWEADFLFNPDDLMGAAQYLKIPHGEIVTGDLKRRYTEEEQVCLVTFRVVVLSVE